MEKCEFEDMEDDFVMLGDKLLPVRSKNSEKPPISEKKDSVTLSLHNINSQSGDVLVSIQPPKQPDNGLKHTPCDIVLVIDVSGSMNAVAELLDTVDDEVPEFSGLSILDLVKHSARTILQNLNEEDRLAIVTFSTHAKTIHPLFHMTESHKRASSDHIESLRVHDSTNLWAGIKEGISIFSNTENVGNVQRMFILTDGMPNHMNPAQGFCTKLKPILKGLEFSQGLAPTISTFGFGYSLKSGLLRSIAEVGRGSYSFIPDVGMIGTVFVHAVANLFSTYAYNVELALECPDTKAVIQVPTYFEFNAEQSANTATLHLGVIQYGQSRDIVIKVSKPGKGGLKVNLRYQVPHQGLNFTSVQHGFGGRPTVPKAILDYHLSRHELCSFLAGLSDKTRNNEHSPQPVTEIATCQPALKALIQSIKGRLLSVPRDDSTEDLSSLLNDLQATDPADAHGAGQISLALQTSVPSADPLSQPPSNNNTTNAPNALLVPPPPYSRRAHHYGRRVPFYVRWGQHYLPSILHAHALQCCTSFKDPGPLRYGVDSPLFQKCVTELDTAFDNLPPPTPSLAKGSVDATFSSHGTTPLPTGHAPASGPKGIYGAGMARNFTPSSNSSMSRYNSRSNPCFAAECIVRCIDGLDLRVDEVRAGDILWTKGGGRMVQGVVKTEIVDVQELCRVDVGGIYHSRENEQDTLWITPYHPILYDEKWVFPRDVTQKTRILGKGGYVYSFILEKDSNPNAHTVMVGGVVCVTLGHGLVGTAVDEIERQDDVRVHPFFGNYDKVMSEIERLDRDDCGRKISGGVVKCGFTGLKEVGQSLACGFLRPGQQELDTHQLGQERVSENAEVGIIKARL